MPITISSVPVQPNVFVTVTPYVPAAVAEYVEVVLPVVHAYELNPLPASSARLNAVPSQKEVSTPKLMVGASFSSKKRVVSIGVLVAVATARIQ